MEINEKTGIRETFNGMFIPRELITSRELSLVEAALFMEIRELEDITEGEIDYKYLANFCSVSVPTIKKAIENLIKLKYIEKISKKDKAFLRITFDRKCQFLLH